MMRLLKILWEYWKAFGRRVGDLQARLLLFLFYFLVLAPFALVVRTFSDPLGLKRTSPPDWRPRRPELVDPVVSAKRQF